MKVLIFNFDGGCSACYDSLKLLLEVLDDELLLLQLGARVLLAGAARARRARPAARRALLALTPR